MNSQLFDNFGYYSNTTAREPYVSPVNAAARIAERKDAAVCETKLLEMNPLWHPSAVIGRGLVQVFGSFMMVLTSVLIMVSYDAGTSPMASSFAVAMPYFLVLSICPAYHFNPALTIIGGIIPLSPCDFAPDPNADKSTGHVPPSVQDAASGFARFFVSVLPRMVFDVSAQLVGSICAAALVWQGMNMSGTDIISRFDAQVRDDIANDPYGSNKVFWYVFLFSSMLAIVYYGIRYSEKRTTCISVQTTLNPLKIGIISASYFLFTAALAPILGVGGLNLIVSVGPAVATAVAPMYYVSVVFGQLVGFGMVAIVFRYIVYRQLHSCGCNVPHSLSS